jgi:hypothetical protein
MRKQTLSNMGPLMGNPMQTLESHDTGSLAICRASQGGQTQAEKMQRPRNFPWLIESQGKQLPNLAEQEATLS